MICNQSGLFVCSIGGFILSANRPDLALRCAHNRRAGGVIG